MYIWCPNVCGRKSREENGDFIFQESQRFSQLPPKTHGEQQWKLSGDIAASDLQVSVRTRDLLRLLRCSGPMKPQHLSNQSTLPEQTLKLSRGKREEFTINESGRTEEEDCRNYKVIF